MSPDETRKNHIRKMKIEIGRPIDLADVALIDEFLKLSP